MNKPYFYIFILVFFAGILLLVYHYSQTKESQYSAIDKENSSVVVLSEINTQGSSQNKETISNTEHMPNEDTTGESISYDFLNNQANCEEIDPTFFDSAYSDELHDRRNEYFSSLSVSKNKQSRTAHALFSAFQQKNERLDKLFENLVMFPEDPLIASEVIRLCTIDGVVKGAIVKPKCKSAAIHNIVHTHLNEGAVWLEAISYFAKLQQHDQVLAAIHQLSQAQGLIDTSAAKYELYLDSLKNANIGSFKSNIIAILGLEAAEMWSFESINNWCLMHEYKQKASEGRMAVSKIAKAEACLQFGKEIENQAKDHHMKNYGLMLQFALFKQQERASEAGIVERKLRETEGFYLSANVQNAILMTLQDETLFRTLLNNRQTMGEQTALELLIEDIIYKHGEVPAQECQ